MVSVRKSHQMSATNFEHWLGTLELNDDKKQALELVWQKINHHFVEFETSQEKALEMVEILASLNLDKDSLSAAFLIPLIECKCLDLAHIKEHYSAPIYLLCKGVRQMDAIKSLQQNNTQVSTNQVDNIRRMLLSMVEDVRAVVIKLAERLCQLRLVKNSDEDVRVLVAKETANIYAPLANRLGIGQLKWELEDIAFRYLHPDVYKKIAKLLDEKRLDRESYMVDFVSNLDKQLKQLGIKGKVYGRPKHIYSIWKKMQQKSLDFEQLFDVRAVRIIVEKLQDCYSSLGIVHTNWNHLHNEFDDYVATPKANGYQSIHTVIIGPAGKAVEVQIRTQQMDDDAELGVAAHWRYKEGSTAGKISGFDEKIGWLRKILQWQDDVSESGELIDELRSQVFEDRIYVFTPNGDVIDLPAGATPLDFAYYIHSNVGNCCIGAKVFGRIVPFTYVLQTGDQVEILTSKKATPSRDWLNPNLHYIKTPRARAKVQHYFKVEDRDIHLASGKSLLENELNKHHIDNVDLKAAIKRFDFVHVDDLYVAIGSSHLGIQQVVNFITQTDKKTQPQNDIDPKSLIKAPSPHKKSAADSNGIIVSGVGNLLTHMANCCQPVPCDDISGFITQGRGISIHRQDCEQFANLYKQHPERYVDVEWGIKSNQYYQASVQIFSGDRQGLFRDISTIIANERVSILGIDSLSDDANQTMLMTVKIEISSNEMLTRLILKLQQLDDVIDVKRV